MFLAMSDALSTLEPARAPLPGTTGDSFTARLFSTAALIELGLLSGYLDINELDRETLRGYVLMIRDTAEGVGAPEAAQPRRLLERLDGTRDIPSAPTESSFHAFESYLSLTSVVLDDDRCARFLARTSHNWSKDDDLPFLISPRHFAQAVATGRVGAIEVPEVAGGLSALGYFEWFSDILNRAAGAHEFRQGLLDHAAWSHNATIVTRRLSSWAEEMTGWIEAQHVSLAEWDRHVESVFGPIAAQQSASDSGGVELQHAYGQGVEQVDDTLRLEDAEFLLSQGRVGEAQRAAREEVWRLELLLAVADAESAERAAVALPSACERLANYGDADSAAAVAARTLPALERTLGRQHESVTTSARILARVRNESHVGVSVLASIPSIPAMSANAVKAFLQARAGKKHAERAREGDLTTD